MKIFNFHLMPYADADLDAIERNGSAWVTFSNSYYDPVKGAELYHRYLDELEYADKLGFDGVVPQRASPDRLWPDADARRARRRARAQRQARQDRGPRPRAAARSTIR